MLTARDFLSLLYRFLCPPCNYASVKEVGEKWRSRGGADGERAFLYVVSINEERKTRPDGILADLSQNFNILWLFGHL